MQTLALIYLILGVCFSLIMIDRYDIEVNDRPAKFGGAILIALIWPVVLFYAWKDERGD